MTAQTFALTGTVTGMSCGHCVASVTEEVKLLPGVHEVSVDLPTGLVRRPVDRSTRQSFGTRSWRPVSSSSAPPPG